MIHVLCLFLLRQSYFAGVGNLCQSLCESKFSYPEYKSRTIYRGYSVHAYLSQGNNSVLYFKLMHTYFS